MMTWRMYVALLWLGVVGMAYANAEKEPASTGTHGTGADAAPAVGDAAPTTPTISLPRMERSFSPAEAELLQELEQKRIELERRQQALELRENLADMLEERLAARTKELEQLKTDLQGLLMNISGKDDKDLQQLAQMYAAMKPAAAAGVLDRLDNAIVHDVLVRMPVKKSGKILEALDPAKARRVSEMMAVKTMLPDMGNSQ